MLWSVLINPLLLVAAAAVGTAGCRAIKIDPHPRDMVMALVVFLIASQAAMVPVVFQRRTTAMRLTQAALVGMVIHLMLAIGLAMLIMVTVKVQMGFVCWTLGFYWVTLSGLAFVFIRAVRSATAVPQA